ncbi:MAG: lamin tail domain-containing protein [Sphingobacteriales bacterium]|nr:MAG: lamin tail domain-containing protein [Sphingobacteriales bacterium]
MFKNLLPVFFFTLFAFVASGNLNAQCSELYFSEYVEGNFNNKALEIYNPTDNAIDLSGYRIIRWSNGNNIYDPIASVQLSGSINAKDVMVIVVDLQNCSLTGADTCVFQELKDKADLFVCPVYEESNALYHNGNDALSLNKIDGSSTAFGATGTFVDIFGLIGEDPGVSWTNTAPYTQSAGGAYWTRDKTLIRKPGVTAGFNF